MIRLTRLNDSEVVVNALLIEQIEATPDTVITLTTGRRLMVRECPQHIIDAAVCYLGELHQGASEDSPRRVAPGQWGRVLG